MPREESRGPLTQQSLPYEEERCIDLFFPGFTWKSFILYITFIQITIFIVAAIMGSTELNISMRVNRLLGASYGPLIQKGEVFRFITPVFLHLNLWHITINSFFQLMMGFGIERDYGIPRFILLYVCAGIGGNLLFVASFFCHEGVGASTSGFGLIGIQFAYMALAWHMMRNKERAIMSIIVFIMLNMLMGLSMASQMAHLGGAIVGFCFGIIYNKDMEFLPGWYTTGYWVAISTLIALVATTLGVIFGISARARGC